MRREGLIVQGNPVEAIDPGAGWCCIWVKSKSSVNVECLAWLASIEEYGDLTKATNLHSNFVRGSFYLIMNAVGCQTNVFVFSAKCTISECTI